MASAGPSMHRGEALRKAPAEILANKDDSKFYISESAEGEIDSM